jgi:hypothetical protein
MLRGRVGWRTARTAVVNGAVRKKEASSNVGRRSNPIDATRCPFYAGNSCPLEQFLIIVTSGCKVVRAFLGRVEVDDAADGIPEAVDGPFGCFSQMRLQLGKGYLNRVESGL